MTNFAIDNNLLEEAQKLGHHQTREETVKAALDDYVKRRKLQGILSLFGTIEYHETYDYKCGRKGKRT
jgi:hypothetical protein